MNVVIKETFGTPELCYVQDSIHALPDDVAVTWCRAGIARPTTRATPEQRAFAQWFRRGTGRPCLYLPWTGEFGWQVMHRMRFVHFHRAAAKRVCIKPGEEVLYPSADGFVTEWTDPVPDKLKAGSGRAPEQWPALAAQYPGEVPIETGGLTTTQEWMCPIALGKPIELKPRRRGLRADVVLGIRHREFCPQKNWTYWDYLAGRLQSMGFSVAVAGKKPFSLDVHGQAFHAGDYPDTDASVELLQHCKLFIGSDTGIAHLASVCGSRMLVFREIKSGQRNFIPRMQQTNPGRVDAVDGWSDPSAVADAALNILRELNC